jgi:hypothetical protein
MLVNHAKLDRLSTETPTHVLLLLYKDHNVLATKSITKLLTHVLTANLVNSLEIQTLIKTEGAKSTTKIATIKDKFN